MTQCERCFYNREMRAWGETFYACHYRLETKKEIYESDTCSGFDPVEKQIELNLFEL